MTSTARQGPDGPIRVLIADDNGSFRTALQKLIDRQAELAASPPRATGWKQSSSRTHSRLTPW